MKWNILLEMSVCALSVGDILSARRVSGIQTEAVTSKAQRNAVTIRQPNKQIAFNGAFIKLAEKITISELTSELEDNGYTILTSAEEVIATIEAAIQDDKLDDLLKQTVLDGNSDDAGIRTSILALCKEASGEILCMHQPPNCDFEKIQWLRREDGQNNIGEGMILIVSKKAEAQEEAA